MTSTTSQWTTETVRALGVTTDVPTLGSIFGLGRWRSYQMAHTGEWERAGIRIISLGARYRVTVQSILDLLSKEAHASSSINSTQPESGQVPPAVAESGASLLAPSRSAEDSE